MKKSEFSEEEESYLAEVMKHSTSKFTNTLEAVTKSYEPLAIEMIRISTQRSRDCAFKFNTMSEINSCSEEINDAFQEHQQSFGQLLQERMKIFGDCAQLPLEAFKKSKNKSDFERTIDKCTSSFLDGLERKMTDLAHSGLNKMRSLNAKLI